MKTAISIVTVWAIVTLLVIAMTAAFPDERPTREYVIWYDAGQVKTVEADGIDGALSVFRDTTKFERIYSCAQRSYVDSVWIGGTAHR